MWYKFLQILPIIRWYRYISVLRSSKACYSVWYQCSGAVVVWCLTTCNAGKILQQTTCGNRYIEAAIQIRLARCKECVPHKHFGICCGFVIQHRYFLFEFCDHELKNQTNLSKNYHLKFLFITYYVFCKC